MKKNKDNYEANFEMAKIYRFDELRNTTQITSYPPKTNKHWFFQLFIKQCHPKILKTSEKQALGWICLMVEPYLIYEASLSNSILRFLK